MLRRAAGPGAAAAARRTAEDHQRQAATLALPAGLAQRRSGAVGGIRIGAAARIGSIVGRHRERQRRGAAGHGGDTGGALAGSARRPAGIGRRQLLRDGRQFGARNPTGVENPGAAASWLRVGAPVRRWVAAGQRGGHRRVAGSRRGSGLAEGRLHCAPARQRTGAAVPGATGPVGAVVDAAGQRRLQRLRCAEAARAFRPDRAATRGRRTGRPARWAAHALRTGPA